MGLTEPRFQGISQQISCSSRTGLKRPWKTGIRRGAPAIYSRNRDCGTGKTTTIRRFKDILDNTKFMVMYLADSKLTPRHFYKGLLEQLGCEAKFYRVMLSVNCIKRLN